MENNNIELRPAMVFAFWKVSPLILLAIVMLLLAWCLSAYFMLFSMAAATAAWYRLVYIRRISYLLTAEYLRIRQGLLFKRVDQVELYRVKDFIITQSFVLQLFNLMDLSLKTTDPENPILWLRGIPNSSIVDVIRERVQETRNHNPVYEIN